MLDKKIIQIIMDEFEKLIFDLRYELSNVWFDRIINNTVNDVKLFKYKTDEELKIKTLEIFNKKFENACQSDCKLLESD